MFTGIVLSLRSAGCERLTLKEESIAIAMDDDCRGRSLRPPPSGKVLYDVNMYRQGYRMRKVASTFVVHVHQEGLPLVNIDAAPLSHTCLWGLRTSSAVLLTQGTRALGSSFGLDLIARTAHAASTRAEHLPLSEYMYPVSCQVGYIMC